MSAPAGLQDVMTRVQARVQTGVTQMQTRMTEVRSKFGGTGGSIIPEGGFGFGFMDRFKGTSGQRFGNGVVVNQLKAKARTRPMLGKMMSQRMRSQRPMRPSIADKPNIADDVYAQNQRRNTPRAQDLSVQI